MLMVSERAQGCILSILDVDVEGAFLQGKFRNGEVMYADVPDGMEQFYGSRKDVVLQLLVPIYGTKQAANCFYETFVEKAVRNSDVYQRSKAEPCLYYAWIDGRLVIFVSWIDDFMILGHPQDVARVKQDISSAFVSQDEGSLMEYVGVKCDFKRGADGIGTMKVTQPVLVQKLKDAVGESSRKYKTPAMAGLELVRGDDSGAIVDHKQIFQYRSLTAVNMYVMQWSRPEIYNATRGQSRMMQKPQPTHMNALK
eukprot:scaffold22402_cov46-Cyclotella_meneghiniana.AAC.1